LARAAMWTDSLDVFARRVQAPQREAVAAAAAR
jgi:hypothetical protein